MLSPARTVERAGVSILVYGDAGSAGRAAALRIQSTVHAAVADGGIDLQLLGIGRNGHIGFNEPSALSLADALALPTRLTELHPVTQAGAAREFGGEHRVIPRALTMGVAPILAARSILMLATGAHKADVVARALNGPMTAGLPASLLLSGAPRVTWMLDEPAAAGLF